MEGKIIKRQDNYRSPITAIYGVLPISIYTKPYACGGACIYCPTDKKFPKSYLENEDTEFARSVNYSSSKQLLNRLNQIGEKKEQINMPFEVIILGGSFSSLPFDYRREFIANLYEAMNEVKIINHKEENNQYNSARYRCSVLTVESRPDQITEKECQFLRELGVSKVELGIQNTDDNILQVAKRGHGQNDILKATRLLKDNGFKVGYHLMIGLPNSSLEKDKKMLQKDIWEEVYSPDYIKVYPCVLLANAKQTQPKLYKMWMDGEWLPPTEEYSLECLHALCKSIPNYVRVSRIQRQFDDDEVENSIKKGIRRRLKIQLFDLREREAGKRTVENLKNIKDLKINTIHNGNDSFIEATNQETGTLYGMLRLRKCQNGEFVIRELKVYGQATPVGLSGQVQGKGLGTLLLKKAESLVIKHGKTTIKTNAAVGARSFFLNSSYKINHMDSYLHKKLS